VVGMRIYKGPVSRERNMVPTNPIRKGSRIGNWKVLAHTQTIDIERVIARNLLKTSYCECSACGGVVGVVLIYQRQRTEWVIRAFLQYPEILSQGRRLVL
jgi:hypothetical protein